jgi:hypothetical protein
MIAIVLLVVCLGVSLGSNGFLYMHTVDLRSKVEELTGQIDNLNTQISDLMNIKNFTFELPQWSLFVRLELSFMIVEGNLSIIAWVNVTQGGFIVVFDRDGDGKIMGDDGWMFYGGPKYRDVLSVNSTSGMYGIYKIPPYPSPYHHVIESENATTFYIMLPLDMLNLHNDLIYVAGEFVSGRGVLFHFGLEV